jgi:dimethylhistidine N-methyltransferase
MFASATRKNSIYLHEVKMAQVSMMTEVHQGLSEDQKTLPAKYFYDETGSALFDAITELPEYYQTRTEIGLLKGHASEMADLLGEHSYLLELGSGSSIKIRLLLDAIRPDVYIPMDISREHLIHSAQQIANDYPWLEVHATCVDYSQPWDIPDFGPGKYNAFFPGSSIGNFMPDDAMRLLKQIHRLVGSGGGLLVGVDLVKDVDILEAAYNDLQGITAAFNLNMLSHINHSLDADFDLDKFEHRALFNKAESRIEMHLHCIDSHCVSIDDNEYRFEAGETIHTENSYKYSIAGFQQLARQAGFLPVEHWCDTNQLFSIHYLRAA